MDWMGLKAGMGRWMPSPRCLLCEGAATQVHACDDCWELLQRLRTGNEVCPLCAKPSLQAAVCGECQRQQPHFERLWASYRLAWPLHSVIAEFKYQQQWAHARALTVWMAAAPPRWLSALTLDEVIAMPLSRVRLLERGYNQAQVLVHGLQSQSLLICSNSNSVFIERQHRSPQSTLKHDERMRNVRGVFKLKTDVNKRNLLLIDDVVTTSATLNELARTLKTAGAASVSCWVLARA